MLYFIEGIKAISDQTLSANKLTKLIDAPRTRECANGPGGKGGLLVGESSSSEDFKFCNSQVWVPRFGVPGTWVGMWSHRPSSPSELARPHQVAGPDVKLLDDQCWKIPLLREWQDDDDATGGEFVFFPALPSVLKRSQETGLMVPGDVVARYRNLWTMSCGIAEIMLGQMQGGRVELDEVVMHEFLEALMLTNYRVGLDEIGLLGLMDKSLYGRIVTAALDWDRLRAIIKKRASRVIETGSESISDGPDSTSGETPHGEARTTATAQP